MVANGSVKARQSVRIPVLQILAALLVLAVAAACTTSGPSKEPRKAFPPRPNATKAMVLVHGLGGKYQSTWGQFPDLLYDDPDLAGFQVVSWGYPSGFLGWQPSVQRVGQALMTEIRTNL